MQYKNKNNRLTRLFLILFCFTCILHATPINIDEILSKKQQLRLMTQLSYINIKSKNSLLTNLPYQMPDGSYITIPILSLSSRNQDYLNFAFNVRYGVYKRVELFSAINAFWQSATTNTNGVFSTQSKGNFNSWNLGITVEAKKEGKFPSLLVGGSADILNMMTFGENNDKLQYFKGYSFFITSFYTVDPIVFLLQANFRLNLTNQSGDININNGEIFSLNPAVYFAVNPYVSLSFSIKYQYKTQDILNGKIVGMQGSSIAYRIGVAYEIKHKFIVFFDTEHFESNDYVSNAINLSLSYRI